MKANPLSILAVSSAMLILACSEPQEPVARGHALFDGCKACHGVDALGDAKLAAPAIAGLPQWYIESQLNKFRKGIRGAHVKDLPGLRMRPMALTLTTEQDLLAVATYVAGLPPATSTTTSVQGGNADKGKALFLTCTACHGPNGNGNEALKAPTLKNNADWYLVTQLNNFRTGVRGAKEGDVTGAQMAAIAATLKTEQDVKDVVAYIMTLPK